MVLLTHEVTGQNIVLQNSDHQGMTLVSSVLTGSNYLAWSRSIKIALVVKLGFIDGKCACLSEDSPDYEQWLRVDYMVTSWIYRVNNRFVSIV